MSSHEEMMRDLEKTRKEMHDFFNELKAHHPDHLIKVVLGDFPDCTFCQGLKNTGRVVQDEGNLVRGVKRKIQAFGNEAYVLVPKTWLGKEVRISLIEE